jgi:hypothetical protein
VLQNINTLVVSLPVLVLISIAQSWRNGLKNAAAFLLLIALSPIPAFYLRSAALEVQSGCFLGVAILLGLINSQQPSRRLLLLSNAFLLLACLYKDTIAPTFAITVALALFLAPAPKPSLTSLIWSWGPGLFGAIAFCVAWNVVRYNSFLPVAYQTEASLNRPSLSQALTSLTALIFSPNGGLVCFWGTTCAGVLLVLLFRKCLQSSTLVFPWLLLTTFVLLGIGTMALVGTFRLGRLGREAFDSICAGIDCHRTRLGEPCFRSAHANYWQDGSLLDLSAGWVARELLASLCVTWVYNQP